VAHILPSLPGASFTVAGGGIHVDVQTQLAGLGLVSLAEDDRGLRAAEAVLLAFIGAAGVGAGVLSTAIYAPANTS
jgi:hypothetical protein